MPENRVRRRVREDPVRPSIWVGTVFVGLWLLGRLVQNWTAPAIQQQRIDYADPANPCDGIKDREINPWCAAYLPR